jgi:hypothetical protein
VPTLRDYRRLFSAHAGGGLFTGTATSGSSRVFLEDTLLKSSINQGDQWNEWYLFRPDAVNAQDRVRQIDQVDLVNGYLYPDWPEGSQYAAAPFGSVGEVYELHSPWFHPTQQIHRFINEALKLCLIPGEIGVPVLSTVGRHAVTTYQSWLTDAGQLFQVGFLYAGEARNLVNPYQATRLLTGRIESDLDAIYLRVDRQLFGTLATTTLAVDLNTGFNTMEVVSVSSLPTSYPYTVAIGQELITVTESLGGPQLLVERGALGTAEGFHASGASVQVAPVIYLRGLFPAYYFCRNGIAEGTPRQYGLSNDADTAIPAEQWVIAGALKEAWTSAPQVMEQLAEQHRILNLQQATLAFQRWQEQSIRRARLQRTFREIAVATI